MLEITLKQQKVNFSKIGTAALWSVCSPLKYLPFFETNLLPLGLEQIQLPDDIFLMVF